ncbi:undecaprenyl-phosphate glucose phosphotransferase [Amantichitinum ursilacus]|uniref:UDP-glucose:undecaprenyl-phosphate glucose-1-phosphate transferase n=1 Tax=Amantichitinum ursilacus TaxID=857265 RepID=A0A0N0XHX7_9NEIS|nr:undecaprenyl-phosphate glucose phosphotransferase [Amantichitinum ursilacus]KPC51815.1 UDP-glucose:undecaprenyl-phosphate glucose-1-phosphate transferase [Amantichitinum ursilacus]
MNTVNTLETSAALSVDAARDDADALPNYLLGDRFGEFSKVAPVASVFKLVVDPVLVVGTMVLLAWLFDVAISGYTTVLAVIAFLLSALVLEGTVLFVPGNSRPWQGLGKMAVSWLLICMFLYLLGSATHFGDYFDPRFVLTWMAVAPVTLVLTHWIIRSVVVHPGHSPSKAKRVAIVGANHVGRLLARRVKSSPIHNIEFVGFFDDRSMDRLDDVKPEEILGPISSLTRYCKEHDIHELYISLPMTSQPRVLQLLDETKDTTASIYFVPDLFIFDLIQARFDQIAGVPVVAVCESPFVGVPGVVKRLIDIFLALAILALIWPIMLGVAIAVKVTSPGPVLFRQRRYGADGQSITVYKFRSMTVMEDGDKVTQATRNDQRLTPIGGFLRKASLDELPQFINVLQGRMSVVGPRPHANAHNELYRKLIKGYMIRHKVKPGITGWAQVNGYRGETDTLDKMRRRIDFDLEYLRNWTVWMDIKIVLKTVTSMINDRNAF